MRRSIISFLFALLLLFSVIGLRNIATELAPDGAPVVLASGGSPPPIPRAN